MLRCRKKPTFSRDPSTGEIVARCKCGWVRRFDKRPSDMDETLEIGSEIFHHRSPAVTEPLLKIKGFVSGLSDILPGR